MKVERLYAIQATHVWPGVLLIGACSPLLHLSAWWGIPCLIGAASMLLGVLKMQRVIRLSLDKAEREARDARPG